MNGELTCVGAATAIVNRRWVFRYLVALQVLQLQRFIGFLQCSIKMTAHVNAHLNVA